MYTFHFFHCLSTIFKTLHTISTTTRTNQHLRPFAKLNTKQSKLYTHLSKPYFVTIWNTHTPNDFILLEPLLLLTSNTFNKPLLSEFCLWGTQPSYVLMTDATVYLLRFGWTLVQPPSVSLQVSTWTTGVLNSFDKFGPVYVCKQVGV